MQAGEREIQHLREAARLTREEAVQSLAHTSGDVHAALNNELSSYHLRLSLLDDMIQEYVAYRWDAGGEQIVHTTLSAASSIWADCNQCHAVAWR